MPPIANRVAHYGTTIFSTINDLASAHQAVNLGQGRPDFDGPYEVIEAAMAAMRDGRANQYPPGTGIAPLRQGVAEHARRFYDLDVDPDGGVLITVGASEALFASILAIVNPGDEVILLEPFFDTYLPAVEWAGGVPVFVPMYAPDWRFDPDELSRAFNDRTRAIIINTPHNPTGRVFDMTELTLIAELCQQYDVIVIADEVYEHLTYEGARHIPIATLPGMFNRTLTISSAAKTFSFTGWKVGWVYGNPELVTGVWRVRQNISFAANHPAQFGIAHALTLGDDYYAELARLYAGKRAFLLAALSETGLNASSPEGAFYIVTDFTDVFQGDDMAFAKYLIQEVGVACIPPTAFYSKAHQHLAQSYVRFSFCKNEDILQAATNRLRRLAR